jgi:ketosteroid isomerase-like protein
MKLTVFGETVVATGNFSGEGTDPSGKSFEVHERWTHTWVKMPSGQWQCAAINSWESKNKPRHQVVGIDSLSDAKHGHDQRCGGV